jgi:hypothetical protein
MSQHTWQCASRTAGKINRCWYGWREGGGGLFRDCHCLNKVKQKQVLFRHNLFIYTNQPTKQLTPCSRVLLQKLTASQLVKKFLPYNGNWWFVSVFTTARHLSLPWVKFIQLTPSHPVPSTYIWILSPHLLLGRGTYLFLFGSLTKTLYAFHYSPTSATFLPYSEQIQGGWDVRCLQFTLERWNMRSEF